MSQPQPATAEPLAPFEPGVRDWFVETFATPTPIQAAAWPVIAAGEHVLATAPTGSGKTLTAFLWALNQFAAGRWETGATRVLYVSPLKALNNDIQRNLLEPLGDLSERGAVPALRVLTRSGDTSQSDRQRMLRRPPEILITTPESLMLLLTTTRGRHALGAVRSVVVDEVHALADNRRGTLLFTALERLVQIAGEFQRIALSATVRPLEAVAAHVAGWNESGAARAMRVLDAGGSKALALGVRFPEAARHAADAGIKIWEPMADDFRAIIARNRATLFFTNSRRLAERITGAINQDQPRPLAYAHHGSLSREIRHEVEALLKQGELKAIVATSSLEMGIDIGALDEVVMVQAPPTVAAALQRIGRAGHRVGEVSRGLIYPTHALDFVEAAALTRAVAARDIEPLVPLTNPLDVLCQIIVSMTATEPWPVDEVFELLRRSGPYHSLPRSQFDLVVEMLAGRYAGSRVRELAARVSYDRIRGTLKAQHSAVLALYNSGGVIPDRGYYQIRHLDSGTVIGELDEEFVWEATVGQVFSLGTRNWQIHRISHNDVLVKPTARMANAPPFWRAETSGRSFHYASHIGAFLEDAEQRLAAGDRAGLLGDLERGGFDRVAAEELCDYLARQREASGAPLPHRQHLLLERVLTGPGGYKGPDHQEQLVIHTFWGRRVNRPWALALQAALMDAGLDVTLFVDDNALVLQTREPLDADYVLGLVSAGNLERLLRRTLESSGFFGARFRESAGRALLLTRQRFNARLPLWMSRLQAKKLLKSVSSFEDFPVLLEAWRTCLNDEFDLPALQGRLAALQEGTVACTRVTTTSPSPFAGNVTFDQINRFMYATDRPDGTVTTALSDDLIASAVNHAELRPRIGADTVAAFEAKRQRTAPGYAPEAAEDWAEWIKERVLLPAAEAPGVPEHPDIATLHEVDGDGAARKWLTHRELLRGLFDSGLAAGTRTEASVPDVAEPRSAGQLALEVLSFYGPLTAQRIAGLLPAVPAELLDDDGLISGPLLEGDDTVHYCDRDNFESLLRLQRALRRPRIEARPVTDLPGCVAAWQELGEADLDTALEALRGYQAPVAQWLHDLPAARVPDFLDHQLDEACAVLGLVWQGDGAGRIRLGYPEDLALLEVTPRADAQDVTELFADPRARYGFLQLADRQQANLAEFNERWWQAVWQGAVSADALTPLRQGVAREFKLGSERGARSRGRARPGRRAPRYTRSAWADPWAGTWFLLPPAEPEADPLAELEDAKERARMLIDRYGFLCRELANREGGALRWRALFRALRLMELAGEVVAGHFFDGLSGPQFAPPAALTLLQSHAPAPRTFWCNALDPVAPCGLGLDWPELPQRRPQNYLAFLDGALALVVENLGRRLTFHLPPAAAAEALGPMEFLLARHKRVTVDEINGAAPAASPYLDVLASLGRITSDHRATFLEAR